MKKTISLFVVLTALMLGAFTTKAQTHAVGDTVTVGISVSGWTDASTANAKYNFKIVSLSPREVEYLGLSYSSTTTVHNYLPQQVTIGSQTYSVVGIGDNAYNYSINPGNGKVIGVFTIPSTVRYIGAGAFGDQGQLDTVKLESGSVLQTIGVAAFIMSNIKEIKGLTTSLRVIDSSAFFMSKLNEITLPNGLTDIREGAFSSTKLTTIAIPSSVTKISKKAFQSCNQLTSVTLQQGIQQIEDKAFRQCSALSTLTIPTTVTQIGQEAFANSGLTSINIPSSVLSIGDSAFNGCSQLANVTSLGSIQLVPKGAFQKCIALQQVNLPNNLAQIGDMAFDSCISLQNISIPSSLTQIGKKAFQNNVSLTSIAFASTGSLYKIDNEAFYKCISLTSVTLPNSLTELGYNIFGKCSSLTTAVLSTSMTQLGYLMFGDCVSLQNVTIPNNITNLSGAAFIGCTSLEHISLPNNLTFIGFNSFSGTSLREIVLPNTVNEIGSGAFSRTHLERVVLPDSVTILAQNIFKNCSNLRTVVLGNSVTRVYGNALENCNTIDSIIVKTTTPPTVICDYTDGYGDEWHLTFFANVPRTAKLLVPQGSLSAYQSATYWNEFTNIQEMIENEFTVITNTATDITSNSAVINGQVQVISGSIDAKGFEWKLSGATDYQIVDVTTDDFAYTLTDLEAHTNYVFRAFAVADNDTVRGEQLSFATLNEQEPGSSLTDVNDKVQLTLYPNPASDEVTVSLICMDRATITIYDMQGRIVLTMQSKADTQTIDVSSLAKGTYTLVVQNKENKLIKKLLLK